MNIRDQMVAANLWDSSDPRDPSQEIAAAWQVYEWLAEHTVIRVSNGDGDSCDVDLFPKGQPDSWGLLVAHITAATMPLAICLAALKAVGVEIR